MPTTRTPTYRPHLLVQASGLIGPQGAAYERFSYSFRVGVPGTGPITLSIGGSDLPDYANDVKAFHARGTSQIHPFAVLTGIKVAQINPDGSWLDGQPLYKEACNVPGGGAPGNVFPPQIALAVTLRTDQAGPRGRGRFYVPMPSAACDSATGLMAAPAAGALRDSAVQLVKDINNHPGIDGDNMVMVVASTFGGVHAVTRADVGRAYDTIRSRRNELVESYVPGPIA